MSGFRIELPGRGVELAVTDFGGSGPIAVLSHANGFCGALYAPIAEQLRDRYRVLAFDSRGHGDSSVPEPAGAGAYEWSEFALDWGAVARCLCDRVGSSRVELGVGHSFGGTSLLRAAATEPDLFRRLVVIDPVILPPPPERAGSYQGGGRHPMAVTAERRTAVFPSREAARQSWSRRAVFEDWADGVLELYLEHGFRDRRDGAVELKCSPSVEAAVYQTGPREDLFEVLPDLRNPTVWLHAAKGNFPVALAERAAALSAAIEMRSLCRGHLMAMTHPLEVAGILLDWALLLHPELAVDSGS